MSIEVAIHRGGYQEKEQVISNIEFNVHSGELIGLIGSNGAGKSTTHQAIMGILPFMEGQI